MPNSSSRADYAEWLGLLPEDTCTAMEKYGGASDQNAPPLRTSNYAR